MFFIKYRCIILNINKNRIKINAAIPTIKERYSMTEFTIAEQWEAIQKMARRNTFGAMPDLIATRYNINDEDCVLLDEYTAYSDQISAWLEILRGGNVSNETADEIAHSLERLIDKHEDATRALAYVLGVADTVAAGEHNAA